MSRRRSGNPAKAAGSTYWHGGAPGRSRGDLLLPGYAAREHWGGYAAWNVDYVADVVYVTTDRELARAFAATSAPGTRGGSLYRVVPRSPVRVDPDYATEEPICFTCPAALVTQVVEQHVRMTEEEHTRAGAGSTTWEEGHRMWDDDGFFTMSNTLRALGATEADLRAVGPWRSFQTLSEYLAARGRQPNG